jgi:AP-1 complex subunit mu
LNWEGECADGAQASTGTVQYAPDKSAFVWKIKQLGGAREFLMRAHFGLPSVRAGASVPPSSPSSLCSR